MGIKSQNSQLLLILIFFITHFQLFTQFSIKHYDSFFKVKEKKTKELKPCNYFFHIDILYTAVKNH